MRRKPFIVKPEHAFAPIETALATTKVTKKTLQRVQEQQLFQNIEPMLMESFAALRSRIRLGDPKAIELSFQIAGMVKSDKSPAIINQIFNKNESHGDGGAKFSFEAIVRKLDARDAADRAPMAEVIEVQDIASSPE